MKQYIQKVGERIIDPYQLKRFIVHRVIPWSILVGLVLLNDSSIVKLIIILSGMVVFVRLMDGYK